MSEHIIELFETLFKSNEIRKIDYKRNQYNFNTEYLKSKFIKDVLCIANAPGGDGYIVLGVKAEKGRPREIAGITYHHDGAELEAMVNSVVEEPIQFEYQNVEYKGKGCAIIHIPISIGRPHWPKKDFGILKKRVFYTRRASGNREASIAEIRQMCMETVRISDIAKQKAQVSHHVVDELTTLSMDERKYKMHGMLKSIARKIALTKYRSMTSTFLSEKETEFVLVRRSTDKAEREYSIIMYPWSAKAQDIIFSRIKVRDFISPHRTDRTDRTNRLGREEKERLKISALIHIAYKNIYTSALEKRALLRIGYWFANEQKESWGKVIKWEETLTKKAKYEFFMPNVSSKEELRERLEQLFEWTEKNIG